MSNKNPKKRKRLLFLLLFSFAISALGIFSFNYYYKNFVAANVKTNGQEVFLYIYPSYNLDSVYQKLLHLDVLENPKDFKSLAKTKKLTESNILPGKYQLKDGMSTNSLINHLRAGNGKMEVKLRFANLRNVEQLSGALSKNIRPDSIQILNWLKNPDSLGKYGFNSFTIPAFFIPNTYFVNWEISTPQLMKRMAWEYKRFWNEERKSKAKQMGFSQSEVSTMASIVYWETKKNEDMPIIAGVYVNRIKQGMPLQADPTLIFALNDFTIRRVLNTHKEINSPYNTYKFRGLPPGPILVPPIKYIDAVLNYSKHDYLYFVAKEDFSGYSYFAKTYRQHKVYARKFQRELNRRGVYR